MSRLQHAVRRCAKSPTKCLSLLPSILIKYILYIIFRFHKWHILSNIHFSCYKNIVVYVANYIVKPESVVEMGCGLGEIISRINSPKLVAIDNDDKVLKAAAFINIRNGIEYRCQDLRILQSIEIFDLLILVNFTDSIEPENLKNYLMPYILRANNKFIIIDETIKIIERKFNHNLLSIFPNNLEQILRIRCTQSGRFIVLYKIRILES